MCMVTFDRNGCQFRTRLMDEQSADRFAGCLRANSRFTGVSVQESRRTESTRRWFVVYIPTNGERTKAITDRQQAARAQRADEQRDRYEIIADESGRFSWCLNLLTGEVYEVSESTCTCPDYEQRCKYAAISCKHSLMLKQTPAARAVPSDGTWEERYAQAVRDRALWA